MKIREVFVSWKFKKPLILNNRKKSDFTCAEKRSLSEQSPHWGFCLHPREENSIEISV